jgi:predicted nucleic acid-binding protein
MIHLDTSYLIRALVPHSPEDARLRGWIRAQTPLCISAICWTEFLCGPLTERQVALAVQLLGEPVAYTSANAERAAGLFNASGRRRGSLIDCMVAATALGAGASLATANVKDFRRFEAAGLNLEG